MPVLSITKDVADLTMTVVAEFAADPDRVWQLWADPRQLEQWWGPPEWPATFVRHDFAVGGRATYYMTGPDGTTVFSCWKFISLEKPHRLEFDDAFADDHGEPTGDLGVVRMVATMQSVGTATRMTILNSFESAAHLEKLLNMGMEDGMSSALAQIDAVLAR